MFTAATIEVKPADLIAIPTPIAATASYDGRDEDGEGYFDYLDRIGALDDMAAQDECMAYMESGLSWS